MPKPKKSPAQVLTQLGLDIASKNTSPDGKCAYCRVAFDPANSNAKFPGAFCSLPCERRFIQEGLRALSVEDCIRLQKRLDTLLALAKSATPDPL
jgi:hypothetical protein